MWTHINEPWNAARYKDTIKSLNRKAKAFRIKLETFPYDESLNQSTRPLVDGEAERIFIWNYAGRAGALGFTRLRNIDRRLPEKWRKK